MALNPKQARFVAEYLKDCNATQAAIRAGYSAKTAEQQGSRLLGFAEVRKAVDEAMQRRAERTEVKAEDILRELLRLAMVDVGKAFDAEGKLLPLHEMPEDVRRAIAGVETTTITRDDGPVTVLTKVKWWDKVRGLELLGKHLGLYLERHQHDVGQNLEQLLLAARARK